jgi:hypothetical protein
VIISVLACVPAPTATLVSKPLDVGRTIRWSQITLPYCLTWSLGRAPNLARRPLFEMEELAEEAGLMLIGLPTVHPTL